MILESVLIGAVVWAGVVMAERAERRHLWRERFGPDFARLQAESDRIDQEARDYEANRTHWSSKDSGWDIKRIPGTFREDHTKPDQPWNWRYLVQGLIHSTGRADAEAWNERCAELRRVSIDALRRLTANG